MQTSINGDEEPASNPPNDVFGELTTHDNHSSSEPARVSPPNPDESLFAKITDESPNLNQPRVSEPRNDEITRSHDRDKLVTATEDYDSILSDFDAFASKGDREAVGYGYSIGDMVWGKVKSHPWWPGHIYNEAFASPSVRRMKSEGHVLVAFFGDGSYGWFDPGELIPFEENFVEKSRQTTSRAFLNAVEEAVDELMRRRGLGMACKCRNEYNFLPTNVEGYYSVTVGDYEPGIFSSSQISKARDSFQPKGMLSFVQQLAVKPRSVQHRDVELVKKKATILAYRKATFEEFDETYAQAFGSIPDRPPRPSAPVTLDPAKAPLSGRLVIAEALGKGKSSLKPTKTKDQAEKDKYIFKRRDEPMLTKSKKADPGQSNPFASSVLLNESGFSGRTGDSSMVPGNSEIQHQTNIDKVPKTIDEKDIRKPVEGGKKIVKVQKRPLGDLSAEDLALAENKKKKRKKEVSTEQPGGNLGVVGASLRQKKKKKKIVKNETSNLVNAGIGQLPVSGSSGRIVADKVSGNAEYALLSQKTKLDHPLEEGKVGTSSPADAKFEFESGTGNLPVLLGNLHALALNPFHGADMGCPNATRQVFLKYRSLVFQKSLASSPFNDNNETGEGHSNKVPAPAEKNNDKSAPRPVRPSMDPTKGGKKRSPVDRPEVMKKKKKLSQPQEVPKKKQLDESMKKKLPLSIEDSTKTKKTTDQTKAVEKKIPQKSNETQRRDLKESTGRNAPSALQKATRPESSKKTDPPRTAPKPTMLVMKFPAGASLPSSAELRAKFARFGPLDHSATRVFWKTSTCRLVFRHKADAEAACKFALACDNLFGSTNVRCYTREPGSDATDLSELFKKEDAASTLPSQSKESIVQPRTVAKVPVQPAQQSVQLKSILKKPSSDEGGNGNGRGGARVKFSSGGEGSSKSEQQQQFSYVPEVASSSSSYSMDIINSKNFPEFKGRSTKFPINVPPTTTSQDHLVATLAENDFSQQFLNLLTKCSDVVNTLSGALGYVPYHPL